MNSTFSPASGGKKTIAVKVIKIVFALAFLGAGCGKLYGPPAMITEFETVGLGQWFRYFTGVLEVIGAIALLAPRTSMYGALLLAVICAGAFFAQLLALNGDVIHTIAMAAVLLYLAWNERRHSA
ncbi:DoxX family protein [Lysobacter terrae]